jgi:hypothetical protein
MHGRLSGALCQSSWVHLMRAVAREYVYDATDEHDGTKTPPTNAHIRGRIRTYSPIIAAGVPDAD